MGVKDQYFVQGSTSSGLTAQPSCPTQRRRAARAWWCGPAAASSWPPSAMSWPPSHPTPSGSSCCWPATRWRAASHTTRYSYSYEEETHSAIKICKSVDWRRNEIGKTKKLSDKRIRRTFFPLGVKGLSQERITAGETNRSLFSHHAWKLQVIIVPVQYVIKYFLLLPGHRLHGAVHPL